MRKTEDTSTMPDRLAEERASPRPPQPKPENTLPYAHHSLERHGELPEVPVPMSNRDGPANDGSYH